MTFQHFMNDLGWTLLHVTWIACIAVVPIVAVEKLAGSKAARIRNAIAITALGLLICCFPAVFVTVQSANPAAEIPGPTSVTDAVVDASDVMATVSPVSSAAKVQLPFSTAIEMIAKNEADTVLLIEPSVADGSRNLLEGRRWPSAVAGLYCLGLMLMLAKLSTSVWGSMSVRRRSLQVDSAFRDLLKAQASRLGIRLIPALRVCELIGVPVVVGALRPMIVIPASMMTGLTQDELANVLLHELAHLRRFDHYTIWIQRVAESVLFFHPAVWYLSRVAENSREQCCDDLVIGCGVEKTDYAATLYRVARIQTTKTSLSHAVALTGSNPSMLRRRIERLLSPQPRRHDFSWLPITGAVTILLSATIISGLLLNNAVAVIDRTEDAQANLVETGSIVTPETTTPDLLPDLTLTTHATWLWHSAQAELVPAVQSTYIRLSDGFIDAMTSFMALQSASSVSAPEQPSSEDTAEPNSVAVVQATAVDKILRGKVLDSTGAPVANADVLIAREQSPQSHFSYPPTDWHNDHFMGRSFVSRKPIVHETAVTDANGEFRLSKPIDLGDDDLLWVFSPELGVVAEALSMPTGGPTEETAALTMITIRFTEDTQRALTFIYPRRIVMDVQFYREIATNLVAQPSVARIENPSTKTKDESGVDVFLSRYRFVSVPDEFRQRMEFKVGDDGQATIALGGVVDQLFVKTTSGLGQSASLRPNIADQEVALAREGLLVGRVENLHLIPDGTKPILIAHTGGEPMEVEIGPEGRFVVPAFFGFPKFSLKQPPNSRLGLFTQHQLTRVRETTPIKLKILEPTTVNGELRLPNGLPIVGAKIRVSGSGETEVTGPQTADVITDDGGRFSARVLPSQVQAFYLTELPQELHEDYSVMDMHDSLRFNQNRPKLVAGGVYNHPPMVLEKRVSIVGKVIDEQNNPVADTWVSLGDRAVKPVKTSSEGEFRLKASNYWLRSSHPESGRHHRTHLFVANENQVWVPSTIVSRDPWTFKIWNEQPIKGTYTAMTQKILVSAIRPISYSNVPLEKALQQLGTKIIFTIDEKAIRAKGKDPAQLMVTGDYPGVSVNTMLTKILDPLGLTIKEEDNPKRGGSYGEGGLIYSNPEISIIPK